MPPTWECWIPPLSAAADGTAVLAGYILSENAAISPSCLLIVAASVTLAWPSLAGRKLAHVTLTPSSHSTPGRADVPAGNHVTGYYWS